MVERDVNPEADEEFTRIIFSSKPVVSMLGFDRNVGWTEFRRAYDLGGKIDMDRLMAETADALGPRGSVTLEQMVEGLLTERDAARQKGNDDLADYTDSLLKQIDWSKINRN